MNIRYNILRGAAVGVATIVCLFAFSGSPSLFGRECGENDMEIWKDIPEYEGLYQVSSLGRVKSLARKGSSGRVIRPWDNVGGYKKVSLSKQGKVKKIFMHILVANCFMGQRGDGEVVDHIDNNPSNNQLSNLQYLSHRENVSKGYANKKDTPVGVYYEKRRRKWRATLKVENKRVDLGYYNSAREAVLVRGSYMVDNGIR